MCSGPWPKLKSEPPHQVSGSGGQVLGGRLGTFGQGRQVAGRMAPGDTGTRSGTDGIRTGYRLPALHPCPCFPCLFTAASFPTAAVGE